MGGGTFRSLTGAAVVVMVMGVAGDAIAGRAAACRRTCREVLRSECGERLGLDRPERRCKRDLLRRCRREGIDTCRYPIVVGGWIFEAASCATQCPPEPVESCPLRTPLSFVFAQLGTRLTENEHTMQGWFTDHASFALDGASVLGDTVTLRGTVAEIDRITAVTYRIDTQAGCWVERVGELRR